MKNFRTVFIVLLIAAAFLFKFNFTGHAKNADLYPELTIFSSVLSNLENYYVDKEKMDRKELIYGAINGMIGKLNDPHTRFMAPENFKEMKVETKGSFGGLGITIGIKNNKLTVISPIEGTPADLVGIKAGDVIAEIDGVTTENLQLHEAVQKLRGPKGTQVTITVDRIGIDTPLKFTITRDIIQIPNVKSGVLEKNIGYIKIIQFNQNLKEEFEAELRKIEAKAELSGLILDLRNNPGGLLDSAVIIGNELLKNGLIVSTKGTTPQQNKEYYADGKFTIKNYPLIVLINDGSASASEIVAGAVQDRQRGLLIGIKSFGKGSVQTVFDLEDGSGLALTTAKYYTPSGRSIHGEGITPDIVIEGEAVTKDEIQAVTKFEEGSLITDFIKKTPDYTDTDILSLTKQLKEKNLAVRDIFLKWYVKKEHDRLIGTRKEELFLDFDIQLRKAVDIMKGSKVLNALNEKE